MITDAFDRRTIANMEVALERACLLLPTGGEKHRARRIIAGKIIECANRGETSLSRLTEAACAAAMQLSSSAQSVRKKEAAD
jgi:DNA-binding NarL/FixJ family response regulator